MSQDEPTVKEKLQILLAEYNSLRSEINTRLSNAFQIAAIAAAVIIALIIRPPSQSYLAEWKTIMIWSCPFLVCIWLTFHNFYKATIRVQELENEINSRVEEKLLLWENERGGLAKGPWARRAIVWILWLRIYRTP